MMKVGLKPVSKIFYRLSNIREAEWFLMTQIMGMKK